jgi:energy-coupling factor transporter ATP-binding protein EcfA2
MKIIQTADIQVKTSKPHLLKVTELMLRNIEEKIEIIKPDAYIISGDLFEYGNTGNVTELDRSIIATHLINVIKFPHIGEIIIIDGNHDYMSSQPSENSVTTIATIVNQLGVDKLRYFKDSGIYQSFVDSNLQYYVISIHDSLLQQPNVSPNTPNTSIITLYHGMIKEYVDSSKLPIPQHVYNVLPSYNMFPNSTIMAGDIHERWSYEHFYYPGSPMQHTHNEGIFFYVTDKLVSTDIQTKGIYLYEKGVDNQYFYPKLIELDRYISYVTITIDPNYPFNIHLLKNINIPPATHVRLKIKSSNLFLKHEPHIRQLFEAPNVDISFEYTKVFIEQSTRPIIEQLILENTLSNIPSETTLDNNDEIFTSMDKLLLSNEQLLKLFKDVSKPLFDKIKENIEVSDDTIETTNKLFMDELEEAIGTSSKRYNIQFKNIKASNFMLLRDVDVDLSVFDIDGNPVNSIVRVTGSNGVGKTTIYNMLYWLLTGKVYKEMSSRSINQNNMVVFNNRDENVKRVVVNCYFDVNSMPVVAHRSVTLNDNGSLDKQLIVKYDKETTVRLDGEAAQAQLDRWFNEVPDTIMILNQMKIDKLLKWTTPQELNDIILNYIGVDYIDKMTNNLDFVKGVLTSNKPTHTRQEISQLTKECLSKIEEHIKEQQLLEVSIADIKESTEATIKEIASINEELIKVGNLPEIENSYNNEIKELESQIRPYKEPQPLIVIDLVKPTEPDVTEYHTIVDTNNTKIDSLREEYTKDNEELKVAYKTLCDTRTETYKLILSKIQNHVTSINNIDKQITDIYNNAAIELNGKIKLLEHDENKLTNDIHNIKRDISLKEDEIVTLQNEISSGVCSKCNRPFDEVNHEKHVVEINEKINNLQVLIEEYKNDNKSKQEECQGITNTISEHKGKYSTIINREYTTDEIENLKLQKDETQKKLDICRMWQQKLDFQFVLKEIYNEDMYGKFVDESGIVSNYNLIVNRIYSTDKEIVNCESCIADATKIIQSATSEYVKLMGEYQKALQDNIITNNKINEENLINQQQQQLNISLNKQIENIKVKIAALDWTLYKELISQRTLISSKLNELNSLNLKLSNQLTAEAVTIENYKNKKDSLDKELETLIKYESNQIIWKVYSTIIKNNLKRIIFEYYRCYLNNTLSHLLSDVNFKLFWNEQSELTQIRVKDSIQTTQSVKQSSGMETIFLGLSLIYTLHILNVKNSISTIFIDEISGTLNNGKNLSYDAIDFQELFVNILNRFNHKTIFIIDHHLNNIFETITYEVVPSNDGKYSNITKHI